MRRCLHRRPGSSVVVAAPHGEAAFAGTPAFTGCDSQDAGRRMRVVGCGLQDAGGSRLSPLRPPAGPWPRRLGATTALARTDGAGATYTLPQALSGRTADAGRRVGVGDRSPSDRASSGRLRGQGTRGHIATSSSPPRARKRGRAGPGGESGRPWTPSLRTRTQGQEGGRQARLRTFAPAAPTTRR